MKKGQKTGFFRKKELFLAISKVRGFGCFSTFLPKKVQKNDENRVTFCQISDPGFLSFLTPDLFFKFHFS